MRVNFCSLKCICVLRKVRKLCQGANITLNMEWGWLNNQYPIVKISGNVYVLKISRAMIEYVFKIEYNYKLAVFEF